MLLSVRELTKKTNKKSVLIFLQHARDEDVEVRVPAIRESVSNIICFVFLGNEEWIHEIVVLSKGIIDYFLIDSDFKRRNSQSIKRSIEQEAKKALIQFSYYSDYSSWAASAVNFLLTMDIDTYKKRIMLVGKNPLATRVVEEMIFRQLDVYLLQEEYESMEMPLDAASMVTLDSPFVHVLPLNDMRNVGEFHVLLGCAQQGNDSMIQKLKDMHFEIAFDIGIRNFPLDYIREHKKNGTRFYRSDDRAGIAGMVINVMETEYLIKNNLAKTKIGDINIVSGGYMGDCGDIVVDNANDPSVILGIAAGDGTFKTCLSEKDVENKMKIESLL